MSGSVQFILTKQVATQPSKSPPKTAGARVATRVDGHVPPHVVACANEALNASIVTKKGTSLAHSVDEVIVSTKAEKIFTESQSMSSSPSSPSAIASSGNAFIAHGLTHASSQPAKELPVVLKQSRVKSTDVFSPNAIAACELSVQQSETFPIMDN